MPGTTFKIGHLVVTPAALEALATAGLAPDHLVARHVAGDWGQVSSADTELNDWSVWDGTRIISAYPVGGLRVWVITEADRSSTCVLMAGEYRRPT